MTAHINRVARLNSNLNFDFTDERIDSVQETQVVLELITSGICSSELPFFLGESKADSKMFIKYAKYPLNLGHEIVGKVVEVGAKVTHLKKDDFATGITFYGSGFAKYFIEEGTNLVPVPASVNPKYALGEPLMCAINILRSSAPDIGDDVVIIGDGFMSMLMIQLYCTYPLRSLTVIGLSPKKLDVIKELGKGKVKTLNATQPDSIEKFYQDELQGRGAEIVIELAGNAKALEQAAWLVKSKRGKLVIPSYYAKSEPFTIGGYLMRKGPRLIPAHPSYSTDLFLDLRKAIWALEKGIFNIHGLITHEFKFQDLQDAFKVASKKSEEYIKGIVTF